MNLRTTALLAAAAAATSLAALPALAASPENGSVSNATPRVEWTGEAAGYGSSLLNLISETAGADPACEAPACDTFTLEVVDSNDLTISFDNIKASGPGCDCPRIAVKKPDGSFVYLAAEAEKPVVMKIKAAPKGKYELYLQTNEQAQNDASYKASAVLAVPAAAPPAGGEPPAGPAPTPAPGQPQPGQAQPPAQAGPQITIKTRTASARKSKRKLTVAVSSSQALSGVVAQLLKGKKVVAKGKLATLNGAGKVALKGKKLKKGRYTLVVTGKAASGAQAGASVPFTLKK